MRFSFEKGTLKLLYSLGVDNSGVGSMVMVDSFDFGDEKISNLFLIDNKVYL